MNGQPLNYTILTLYPAFIQQALGRYSWKRRLKGKENKHCELGKRMKVDEGKKIHK